MIRVTGLSGAPEATLEAHTVEASDGLKAGYLVRAGGARLGRVWASTTVQERWHWMTEDSRFDGYRSSRAAALQVLVDAARFRLSAPRQPRPLNVMPEQLRAQPQPGPVKRQVPAKPPFEAESLARRIAAVIDKAGGSS